MGSRDAGRSRLYVAVSVMRFDGGTNGQISVVARWSLRDANGKELVMRCSAYLDGDPLLTAQRPCDAFRRKGLQVMWCSCSIEFWTPST
jgi:ABC-type transport auxiliary lipoprotein component